MSIERRIAKLEAELMPNDPLDDAMALVRVLLCSRSNEKEADIIKWAEEFAAVGVGLTSVLDESAESGPEPPRGDIENWRVWKKRNQLISG